ncbi:MAG: DUF3618 domain-containing protein [Chloroflexi bacterium]|nr:DUF3618 domain-containing protein [Chloroflexota bacterium]
MTQYRNDDVQLDAVDEAQLEADPGDTMSDQEQVEVAEIRADIEETRLEMGDTLNELGGRLEPSHLVEQAKENVREATIGRVEETAKGISDMVMDTIKRNPIPAAMAGAGLALLWKNRSQGSNDQYKTAYGTEYGYQSRPAYMPEPIPHPRSPSPSRLGLGGGEFDINASRRSAPCRQAQSSSSTNSMRRWPSSSRSSTREGPSARRTPWRTSSASSRPI